MNPQIEQSPGLRLPQPSSEPAPMQPGLENQPRQEQVPDQEAAAPMPPIPAPVQPNPLAPPPAPMRQQVQMPAVPVAPSDDDTNNDSLDEEWITKAKQLVEMTHTDPYTESNELSKFKASYLKNRHNVIIKTTEDSK